MVCTRCGNEIEGARVMAIYGDPAFAGKTQTPFALDQDCFDQNREAPAAEWVTGPDGEPALREFIITRYVQQ